MTNKKYEFSNVYMFSAVMRRPEICKAVLERILDKRIDEITFPEYEKTIASQKIGAKGIRVDIYCKDEDAVYTVEMQNGEEESLPKRSRYYQSSMDIDSLEKGAVYSELPAGFVIFICRYDPYGEGRHIYTFENRCIQDMSILFGDMTRKIVLNTKGTEDDVSRPLKMFLDYIETQDTAGDDLLQEIDNMVVDINKNYVWRDDTMTFEMEIKAAEHRGMTKARREYENQIRNMVKTMISEGISKDVIISSSGITEEEYEELSKS